MDVIVDDFIKCYHCERMIFEKDKKEVHYHREFSWFDICLECYDGKDCIICKNDKCIGNSEDYKYCCNCGIYYKEDCICTDCICTDKLSKSFNKINF